VRPSAALGPVAMAVGAAVGMEGLRGGLWLHVRHATVDGPGPPGSSSGRFKRAVPLRGARNWISAQAGKCSQLAITKTASKKARCRSLRTHVQPIQ